MENLTRIIIVKVYELLSEDATIPQLQQNIQRGFPDTKKRQHATNEVRITSIKYIPAQGLNVLKVESTTASTNGNQHSQLINFRNANLHGNSDTGVKVETPEGKEFTMDPLKLNTTNVGVYCDCEDYMMRFAAFNIQNKCHLGPPPPPYTRKTTTRPEANPSHVPGMCKHLLKVVDETQRVGILTR